MSRIKEEEQVKKISIAAANLLECYQWDHLDLNQVEIAKRLQSLQCCLKDFQKLLKAKEGVGDEVT